MDSWRSKELGRQGRSFALVITLLALALMLTPIWIPALAARPEMVTICHGAGQEGTTQYVTLTLPYSAVYGPAGHFSEPGSPNAGHEQDYEGACVAEPTPEPTLEPTAEPTAVPTDEPTQTPTDEPTQAPTDEPASEPTQEPTVIPTDEPTQEPTREPTPPCDPAACPEPTPEITPTECDDPVCGYLFHLIGSDGQEADFASFSPRPDGGWYLPNAASQLKCLGWVAVSAPYGRAIGSEEFATLIHCEGGNCASTDG